MNFTKKFLSSMKKEKVTDLEVRAIIKQMDPAPAYECWDCETEFNEEEYNTLFIKAGLYRRPVQCPHCRGDIKQKEDK